MRIVDTLPLVSVVIPVYNTEDYLSLCISSILGQTYKNIEVICVDDGSTDESLSILREFERHDNRVRVFTQKNLRQGAARNHGMDEARGDFLFFMDSDDRLHSYAIAKMVEIAQNENADIVSFNMRNVERHNLVNEELKDLEYRITDKPLDYCNSRDGYRIVCTPCRLYRKKILEDIRFISGISYEDEAFTWEVMLRHPRTVMIKNVFYDYLQNPNSTMHRDFCVTDITHFTKVINYLLRLYPSSGADYKALIRKIIPRLLKEQYMRISNLDGVLRQEVERALAQEITELRLHNAYSILGVGLRRHFIYRKLCSSYRRN